MPSERSRTALKDRPAEPPLLPGASLAIPSASLTASAIRYTGQRTRVYMGADKDWQAECYRHYRICGEAQYAANFFGHAMSRAVLSTAIVDTKTKATTPVTSGAAPDILEALFNGTQAQEQMLESIGIHLMVAGECYLVGRTIPTDGDYLSAEHAGEELWEVVSVLEMNVSGNRWAIAHEGFTQIPLGENDVVIRIWRPDPAQRTRAHSPFKAMLSVLAEIEWCTRHIFNQMSSRLAGAGLLLLSDGITFPPPPSQHPDDGTEDPKAEASAQPTDAAGLMTLLIAAGTAAIKNDMSPEALFPMVGTVPDEVMKSGKTHELIHFWSPVDEKVSTMRRDAIVRFAGGMELPPEQVLGMGSNPGTGGGTSNGVSHWGAWQIEESTIKMFIEPALDLVANAVTTEYLRPLLKTGDQTRVIWNTAKLRLRPDRSKEAMELNDRGILADRVVARENGFDKADLMDDDERRNWLAKKFVGGSPSPDMVMSAAKVLGLDLGLPSQDRQGTGEWVRPGAPQGTDPGNQPGEPGHPLAPEDPTRQAPSLDDHPTRDATPAAAALMAVREAVVLRALERAGNRLRAGHGKPQLDVPSYEIHTRLAANGNAAIVMTDAWSTAPRILAGTGLDPAEEIKRLNAYALQLLATQQPHTRERLAEFLEQA